MNWGECGIDGKISPRELHHPLLWSMAAFGRPFRLPSELFLEVNRMAEWKFFRPRIFLDLMKSMGYSFSVGLNYMVFHVIRDL